MLKEIFGICDFHMIHTDALCCKVRSFMMLQKVAYTLTTHLLFLFSRLFLRFQELNMSFFFNSIKGPTISYWLCLTVPCHTDFFFLLTSCKPEITVLSFVRTAIIVVISFCMHLFVRCVFVHPWPAIVTAVFRNPIFLLIPRCILLEASM